MPGRRSLCAVRLRGLPREGSLRQGYHLEVEGGCHAGRLRTLPLRFALLERGDLRPRTHVAGVRQRQRADRARPFVGRRDPRVPHVAVEQQRRVARLGGDVPERGQGQQHHQDRPRHVARPVVQGPGRGYGALLPRILDAVDGALLRRRHQRRHPHHHGQDGARRHRLAPSLARAAQLRADHRGLPRGRREAALPFGALRG